MFDSDGREGCGLDYENGGDYYREAGGPEVVCPEDTGPGRRGSGELMKLSP
jgi:hypothetical protein